MKLPSLHSSLQYSAMAIGSLASLFFVLFLVGEGVGDLLDGKTGAIPIIIMILFTVAGFVVSWFRTRRGAVIMITGALVMGVYLLIIGDKGNVLMSLAFSLPFLVPGIMLMYLKRFGLQAGKEK